MVFKKNRLFTMMIGVGLILLLLSPVAFKGSYLVDFLAMTAIWVIFASSLRLLTTLGLVSFAHAGFMAIGAYTSALLTKNLGVPFWFALPLSGITASLVALAIGYPILKIKGHYFFLVSFALGMVIVLVFSTQFRQTLGGTMGISNIPYPSAAFSSPLPHYYLALGLDILIIALLYRLDHCIVGTECQAIRGADDLASILGIDAFWTKILAFVVACFFAGISGSLYAHYIRFISPDSFGFPMMMSCLTCVIVGGMYSTWGPAIGVLLLRGITVGVGGLRQWEALIFATILILCVTMLPEGIASLPRRLRSRRVNRKELIKVTGTSVH